MITVTKQKPFEEILKDHPFPDAASVTGEFLSQHVDGIITLERCKNVGMKKLIDFDQAKLMASYNGRAVEVETLKKLKTELDHAKNKRKFLDNFIMEKMAFPKRTVGPVEGQSLKKRLVELYERYYRKK